MAHIYAFRSGFTVTDGRFKTNVTESVKDLTYPAAQAGWIYNFEAKKYDQFISGKPASDKRFASLDYSDNEKMRAKWTVVCIENQEEVEQAAKDAGYDFDGVGPKIWQAGVWSYLFSIKPAGKKCAGAAERNWRTAADSRSWRKWVEISSN